MDYERRCTQYSRQASRFRGYSRHYPWCSTGQADNIVGILVSLLNEYKIDLYTYFDPYTTTLNYDVSDDKMSWQHKDLGVEEFVLGKYLTESTTDSAAYVKDGVTYEGVDKINVAIKNVDNLIPTLIPTILGLLGDTIDGFLGEPLDLLGQKVDLGFVKDILDDAVEKKWTLPQIVGNLVASDELMQIVAELLFNPTMGGEVFPSIIPKKQLSFILNAYLPLKTKSGIPLILSSKVISHRFPIIRQD